MAILDILEGIAVAVLVLHRHLAGDVDQMVVVELIGSEEDRDVLRPRLTGHRDLDLVGPGAAARLGDAAGDPGRRPDRVVHRRVVRRQPALELEAGLDEPLRQVEWVDLDADRDRPRRRVWPDVLHGAADDVGAQVVRVVAVAAASELHVGAKTARRRAGGGGGGHSTCQLSEEIAAMREASLVGIVGQAGFQHVGRLLRAVPGEGAGAGALAARRGVDLYTILRLLDAYHHASDVVVGQVQDLVLGVRHLGAHRDRDAAHGRIAYRMARVGQERRCTQVEGQGRAGDSFMAIGGEAEDQRLGSSAEPAGKSDGSIGCGAPDVVDARHAVQCVHEGRALDDLNLDGQARHGCVAVAPINDTRGDTVASAADAAPIAGQRTDDLDFCRGEVSDDDVLKVRVLALRE